MATMFNTVIHGTDAIVSIITDRDISIDPIHTQNNQRSIGAAIKSLKRTLNRIDYKNIGYTDTVIFK